jgi:ABC-type amino acid transport substrate-binding protein
LLSALVAGLILGALLVAAIRVGGWFGGPDPESIATASLQSMREQSRLTAFEARFVAVVTSSQSRFGLTAEKTLIMPGSVRYEVDLARLHQRDLRWDEASKTLAITLPGLEISRPEIHMNEVREYGGGGVLAALTDAERKLDQANRNAGQAELVRQAKQAMPLRLARDAARRAVERSFAMPLRAAGVEAKVSVRFRDEGSNDPSRLDRSRRVEDVLRDRQAAPSR